MTNAVDRALRLWAEPPPPGAAGVEAFRSAYADPVSVNGTALTAGQLAERARNTHAALADLHIEVVDRVDAGDRCAVVFRQAGRHVARMPGLDVAPSGRMLTGVGIDVFTIVDDRISQIWVVSEVLSRLAGPAR